ncbi:MAG TPA: TerB family tellurite resistance protein [Spirochaetota bacterium]|nr:TerB family tellurite resistance protein [Spirochaetota bacterium]HPJ35756.1 TerB family tellurite resistance protein [Spirochaetota bacterium]
MPKTLSHEEKVVLIGLCKYIISTDGSVTPSELESMNIIADEIGFDDYQNIFNDVDTEITSLELLKEKIENLEKSANRKKILKYAIQISRSDANIKSDEMDILVYAADSWDIDINTIIR